MTIFFVFLIVAYILHCVHVHYGIRFWFDEEDRTEVC